MPPYKSTKAFVLRGEKRKDQIYDDETNFIDMMETNFDVIWEYGSQSLDEMMKAGIEPGWLIGKERG